MISLIENLPPHVIGINISGKVKEEDYKKVLEPAIEKQHKTHDKLNCLIIYDTEIANFSSSAMLEDLKTDFKYYNKWNKVAIVVNKDYLKNVIGVVSAIIPGELKGFSPEEIEQAKTFVK
ncbi:STAS/SEC14 domain-containing protein [Pedobacter sp. SD-b]|uniref:STAS/SEC14 domain-containing protein n=1 Tax=Pedobacter segetis TaxID=2793069 RepID=A0ABS1BFH7_9SPHI|nr:STAS/SEC14 domain-containing protein [Pedobacter segetis]MBK0381605.1 STAS/SEC14 domain-containing protein [Pedobacter segetis]